MVSPLFSIAPMMDWTDRHCRSFHRRLTPHAVLYTEMVTAPAVIRGDRERLLGFEPIQQPVVLQLGGSDPTQLAEAARIGENFGYDAINLNCGCPSDRVQSGSFGACLMAQPELVASCIAAMRGAVSVPVTVKTRIGIDDQEGFDFTARFIETVAASGCDTFILHARKAWLSGLSPKENREIPPLDYACVYALKRAFPHLGIIINGGIATQDDITAHLAHVDGVMLGREAYQNPYRLAELEAVLFDTALPSRLESVDAYRPYIAEQLSKGVPLHAMTRHMLGLFNGTRGGRSWRRTLSERAHGTAAGMEVIDLALQPFLAGDRQAA